MFGFTGCRCAQPRYFFFLLVILWISRYTNPMERKINGNTVGIRMAVLKSMESLYDLTAPQDEFASWELLSAMAEYTGLLGREISVYIARDGRVVDVSVGDVSRVQAPDMRLVRNTDRLCGVRLLHTHPSGNAHPSAVDLGTLRSALLDSMCSMGVRDGKPAQLYAAFLGESVEGQPQPALVYGPMDPAHLPHEQLINEIKQADARFKSGAHATTETDHERAILAGMTDKADDDAVLDELAGLAETAGAEVVGRFLQRRRPIDTATYLGSGKLEELALAVAETNCDLIIFDDELNAVQLRNIEQATHKRVIDRTALILDIFASRAASREGKLQVELAQLKYRLPRLIGLGGAMSRLGGGIGTRGPGEKKLEIDRRRIRRRIFELEREFSEIESQRELRRSKRESRNTPLVALVGYTNAGKSTLINALSGAAEYVSDRLFATLDTVVRKVELPGGTDALVSDTVGFIDKLPHELVQAFRSTLDEVRGADLLLHVVDASDPGLANRIAVVDEVLTSLGAGDIPRILVLNKADKRTPEGADNSELIPEPHGKYEHVRISALTGAGLDKLLETVEAALSESMQTAEWVIPYDRFEVVAFIRENGAVLSEEHEADGTHITARLSEEFRMRTDAMIRRKNKE